MIVVRVERPHKWQWIDLWLYNSFIKLERVDFFPPAAGPEIELSFDTHLNERVMRREIEKAGLNVLAIRTDK